MELPRVSHITTLCPRQVKEIARFDPRLTYSRIQTRLMTSCFSTNWLRAHSKSFLLLSLPAPLLALKTLRIPSLRSYSKICFTSLATLLWDPLRSKCNASWKTLPEQGNSWLTLKRMLSDWELGVLTQQDHLNRFPCRWRASRPWWKHY